MVGCASLSVKGTQPMIITGQAEELSPEELGRLGGLPDRDLSGTSIKPDAKAMVPLRTLLEAFNSDKSSILHEVFQPLLPGKTINVRVIGTMGIPQPYDTWTRRLKSGETVIVFNLDLWSDEDFSKHGRPLLNHELTHVLIHEIAPEPDEKDLVAAMDYLVMNEGIAHFLGYSGDRSLLLKEKKDKWNSAERALSDAYTSLRDPHISFDKKEGLLKKANTGKFWDKFGSIAGMFRAAYIYEHQGAEGLRSVLKTGKLPRVNN